MTSEKAILYLRVQRTLHQQLKIQAAIENRSLAEVVSDAIAGYLQAARLREQATVREDVCDV